MITHPLLTERAGSGIRLGLDAVAAFLDAAGVPRSGPYVHVAGTNGKGSTCAMVEAMLRHAGFHTGLTMSPHLEHVQERVRIDGVPMDDAAFDALLCATDALARQHVPATGGPPLTYFEFVIAAALLAFEEQGCDARVVEVGLGGRLDATNVVHPAITAITHIGRDHVDRLGSDLAGIAREKAGIFEPGVPAVVGPLVPEALPAVEAHAQALGVPLWRVGQEIQLDVPSAGWVQTPVGAVELPPLALAGVHQRTNAAVAVGLAHGLRQQGWHLPDASIQWGLAHAVHAGRMERLLPHVLADGAHNAAGATALAASLDPGLSRVLVFGMNEGRDPQTLLGPLLPVVSEVWITACAHPKAMDARALAEAVGEVGKPVRVFDRAEDVAPVIADHNGEVVVAGSLYVVGALRGLLRPRAGA